MFFGLQDLIGLRHDRGDWDNPQLTSIHTVALSRCPTVQGGGRVHRCWTWFYSLRTSLRAVAACGPLAVCERSVRAHHGRRSRKAVLNLLVPTEAKLCNDNFAGLQVKQEKPCTSRCAFGGHFARYRLVISALTGSEPSTLVWRGRRVKAEISESLAFDSRQTCRACTSC